MRERAGRKKQRQPGRHEGGGTSAGEECACVDRAAGLRHEEPAGGPPPPLSLSMYVMVIGIDRGDTPRYPRGVGGGRARARFRSVREKFERPVWVSRSLARCVSFRGSPRSDL